MTQFNKIILTALTISLILFWGIPSLRNNLGDYFFWKEVAEHPELGAAFMKEAQLQRHMFSQRPVLKKGSVSLSFDNKAALSLLVEQDEEGNQTQRVLFSQNDSEALPIASLSKLMTSLVALQTYAPEETVQISSLAISSQEDAKSVFKEGQSFKVRDLLYSLLMESSNPAAIALSESKYSEGNFVRLMNGTAEILGMEHTRFINPTGLDEEKNTNKASARDIAFLVKYLADSKPELFEMLSRKEFDLHDAQGSFHHTVFSTNELLENGWPTKVLGGKTGYTRQAGECLVLVMQSPKGKGYMINVILGSYDRFGEMRKLVQWLYDSYQW